MRLFSFIQANFKSKKISFIELKGSAGNIVQSINHIGRDINGKR